VFVERLWKSIKYDEVSLRAYETVNAAYDGIGRYPDFYNSRGMKIAVCSARSHSRQFLSEVNREFEYEPASFDSHLCEGTRQMGAGFPAVCAFVSDMQDALVPETATRGSIMSIFSA